jgi:hypothetical protein
LAWPGKKNNENENGGDGDSDDNTQKKRLKKGATGISAGDDEIDEEEELMLMQAMETQGDQDQQLHVEQGESGQSSSSGHDRKAAAGTMSESCDKKRKLSHQSTEEQEHTSKKPTAGPSPAAVAACKTQPLATLAKPASALSVVNGSGPSRLPHVAVAPSMAVASPGRAAAQTKANGENEDVSRPTWSLCKAFLADDYASCEVGKPLATPSAFTKDVQKSKWAAEVMKIKPYLGTFERLMSSSGGKTTDTELKNAVKAMQKINTKLDKKLEYEVASATEEEPALSARASCLKELFESVKNLKDLAIMSGKSGSISADNLTQNIKKIQAAARKLVVDATLGFPMHWVQACWDNDPDSDSD